MRLLAFLGALLVLSACAAPRPAVPDPAPVETGGLVALDFERDVRPILQRAGVVEAGATVEAVVNAGPSGFVVPFDAEGSHLIRLATTSLAPGATHPMPGLQTLAPDEVATLRTWIEGGARDAKGAVPFSDARHLLFACVQGENTVDILDAETMRIVRRVRFDELGFPSAPYGPHHVVFDVPNEAWYVSLISTGAVLKLRLDLEMDPSDPDFLLASTPEGELTTPGMLALDFPHDRLFIGRSTLSAEGTPGFAMADADDLSMEIVATPFDIPHAMTVTPDGRYVLTASLTGNRVAVYNTMTGDLSVQPLQGDARELIHFSVLVPHAMMTGMGMDHGEMEHDGMDHEGMHHGGMGMMPAKTYRATLTSRTTDEVLFFSLSPEGELSLTGTVQGGDGPFHAHLAHDGKTVLVPNRVGDTVTIIDADTRSVVRTIGAESGVISQPHSPAPYHDNERFFVSSSNLNGAWMPLIPYADADGGAIESRAFGNVIEVMLDGTIGRVVQLGAYPSGMEHVSLPNASGEMDHGGMDHEGHGGM